MLIPVTYSLEFLSITLQRVMGLLVTRTSTSYKYKYLQCMCLYNGMQRNAQEEGMLLVVQYQVLVLEMLFYVLSLIVTRTQFILTGALVINFHES